MQQKIFLPTGVVRILKINKIIYYYYYYYIILYIVIIIFIMILIIVLIYNYCYHFKKFRLSVMPLLQRCQAPAQSEMDPPPPKKQP